MPKAAVELEKTGGGLAVETDDGAGATNGAGDLERKRAQVSARER